MERTTAALAALALVMAAACLGCGGSDATFRVGRRPTGDPSTTCPFGIRGARVAMSKTDEGVSIAVRAYGDVEEVRRRARDAAAMYGPGAHRGMGHDGAHGNGQRHGLGLATLGVPVQAEEQNTEEGALIVVKPVNPSDREQMQAALLKRERDVRAGACP